MDSPETESKLDYKNCTITLKTCEFCFKEMVYNAVSLKLFVLHHTGKEKISFILLKDAKNYLGQKQFS